MLNLPHTLFIVHYTVENPWPLVIGLFSIAVIVIFKGYLFITRKTSVISGSIMLVLASVIVLAARFIETDSELINRLTGELVVFAVAGDADSVSNILHNDLKIYAGEDRTTLNKKDILDRVPGLKDFIKSNHLRDVQSGIGSDGRGISIFTQTTVTTLGYPTPNQWRCIWINKKNQNGNNNSWQIIELYWEKWNLGDVPDASMLNMRN